MSDDRSDAAGPAEQRVVELLHQLAARQPTADPAFAHRVVRRARVQRALVVPLRAFGEFLAALSDGARLIILVDRRDRRS